MTQFYYITPQGYIGNIDNNLVKFRCILRYVPQTYDISRLEIMNIKYHLYMDIEFTYYKL
jgi:hypothetical protein